MKYAKWIGVAAVVLMFVSAWLPWLTIESKNIVVYGMDSGGTGFGKPALMNLIVSGVCLLLFLWPAVLAKRFNLFFAAFNLAWAIRNLIVLTTCRAGECPTHRYGLYLMALSSALIVFCTFFSDINVEERMPMSGEQPADEKG